LIIYYEIILVIHQMPHQMPLRYTSFHFASFDLSWVLFCSAPLRFQSAPRFILSRNIAAFYYATRSVAPRYLILNCAPKIQNQTQPNTKYSAAIFRY